MLVDRERLARDGGLVHLQEGILGDDATIGRDDGTLIISEPSSARSEKNDGRREHVGFRRDCDVGECGGGGGGGAWCVRSRGGRRGRLTSSSCRMSPGTMKVASISRSRPSRSTTALRARVFLSSSTIEPAWNSWMKPTAALRRSKARVTPKVTQS